MAVTTMAGATATAEPADAQPSAERNRAWLCTFMRKLRLSVLEASWMLLIVTLIAGTFGLASVFSLLALVLAD